MGPNGNERKASLIQDPWRPSRSKHQDIIALAKTLLLLQKCKHIPFRCRIHAQILSEKYIKSSIYISLSRIRERNSIWNASTPTLFWFFFTHTIKFVTYLFWYLLLYIFSYLSYLILFLQFFLPKNYPKECILNVYN